MPGEGLPTKTEMVEDKPQRLQKNLSDMTEGEALATIRVSTTTKEAPVPPKRTTSLFRYKSTGLPYSPTLSKDSSRSPAEDHSETEQVIGPGISVKIEPGQPLTLARTSSQKVMARQRQLFDKLPDMTAEAKNTFQVVSQCIYAAKYLGTTEHAMECDCAEEWAASINTNLACGDDSDCINRLTKMECFGDCGCGSNCQNQRFQQKQYANVKVIKTEKKGYGLRAETDLNPQDFIFEYVGEVINEVQFRRRMLQYDDEGIKHFYFMSLSKGEFVDATKKGNLGRFCNHSCNPNCYVDKWVVGDKLRMGIFAERNIKAGEELVFNYNVDRYGADPQPCYCGEPNCTGFIGGKTQTERATKLSNTTIEALGIDDGDGWDTAVTKRPRKKKGGEDDEEYVNNVQPKSLDEDGVTKVMATLMQCKEKWIAVKLLGRIQRCEDERVRNRVVKMHGYQILNSVLSTWKEDFNVVLQVMDILNNLPRLTRNKISDSKIEVTVEGLTNCRDERVVTQAAALLKEWSTLEVGYRIPRKKRDPNANISTERPDRYDRRESARVERKERSRSRSPSGPVSIEAPRGPSAPTGPRNNLPKRNGAYHPGARPPYRRPYKSLPPGWFAAVANGNTYYYSAAGQTTWQRPTEPAAQPPPPPSRAARDKALDDIIQGIISEKANTPKERPSATATPQQAAEEAVKDEKQGKDKWKSYSEDKRKKLYENTLFPPIKYVVDKFKTKLPRDDLKRFAKDIAKKLVNSDFKNNRVEDPTTISSKQEKNVKKYVKDFFDRAVVKKRDYDQKKAERKVREGGSAASPATGTPTVDVKMEGEADAGVANTWEDSQSSGFATPASASVNGETLKRKRVAEEEEEEEVVEGTASKRLKPEAPPPPPPPPPPPAEDMPADAPMGDAPSGHAGEGISPVENHSPLTPGLPQGFLLGGPGRKHGGLGLAMS